MENITRRATLLIVDDEPMSIELLARVLEREYEVLAAANGEDALDLAERCLPDLILLDVAMPGLDGYDVCRLLKEKESTREIPVVFVTGMDREKFEVKGLELGASDYIVKPIELSMLRLRVKNIIELKLHRDHLKRTGEQLRQANAYNRSLIEASLDPLVTIGRDGRITDVNAATERVTGYPRGELIGKDFSTYFTDPEKADAGYQRVFREGMVKDYELEIRHRDGHLTPVLYNASIYRDEAGNIAGVFAAARDISARKNLEKQLRYAQKMEAVGTLVGGIAHEFNNIMTAVIGYGSLLKLKLANDAKLLPKVDALLHAADRAAELVRSLLSFSSKQKSEMRSIDLNELISREGELLRSIIREDIELNVSPADSLLAVNGDKDKIEQLMHNLANNAQDAMPNGGKIAISTASVELDRKFTETHGYGEPGRYAVITFSDNGEGMEEEIRQKIFDPFFTTREVGKGTGLGLSICYGIIKQHNGYIVCESEPGKGTVFTIYLPMIKAEAEISESDACAPLAGGTETILIAEDNVNVRGVAREVLEEYGYTVIEAVDGKDALGKFINRRDEIALVIVDVIMPRMNGRELYTEIARLNPGMKVIFSSGYTADVLPEGMDGLDGLPFIPKPYLPDELLRRVRTVLDGKD